MKHLISHKMFENLDIQQERFRLAISRNYPDTVEEYYNKGIDINYRYAFDYTPLILASSFDNLEIVKKLIEWGADMKLTEHKGRNFIDFAHLNVSKWLCTVKAQRLILSKDPSMITSLIKHKLILPSIKKEYPHIFSGIDLNLL
jgi:ankyrin repeat protein